MHLNSSTIKQSTIQQQYVQQRRLQWPSRHIEKNDFEGHRLLPGQQ
jgi:hypothetical protein